MTNSREAEFLVDQCFLDRWSPRAFDGSPVAESDLMRVFEATRWAPSAFNAQPWRFLYACRDTKNWPRMLETLIPFNQSWVRNAGAIIMVLSDTLMANSDGGWKPSRSHSFDAGAAWACLALQARSMGLHTHAMTGVDFDAARASFNVPARYRIECAVAIGRIGDPADLSDGLRAREVPSGRRAVQEFVFSGSFPADDSTS